jgi:hypothetical protein
MNLAEQHMDFFERKMVKQNFQALGDIKIVDAVIKKRVKIEVWTHEEILILLKVRA